MEKIDTIEADHTEDRYTLSLIRKLCQRLDADQIRYCHWKSNLALDRCANGENDLDFLISQADHSRFLGILGEMGFKHIPERGYRALPGIDDYYGCDPQTHRLVHVHAHFQLVLGYDDTKNYHIPVEEAYLASASPDGIFRVPRPEFELILLVIRLVLKHGTWDTMILKQGRLSSGERAELDYLRKRISEDKLYEILGNHFSYLHRELFDACLNTFLTSTSLWTRIRLGEELLACLAPYARRPRMVDAGLKVWYRFAQPIKVRIFHKPDQKALKTPGFVVAIVGGDGAGKTTVVKEIFHWLSAEFDVYQFHMGKPRWSLLTILVRGVLKIGRSLGFYPFMKAEIEYTLTPGEQAFPGYPWLIREICTARDRVLTFRKARALSRRGGVVILDRFPLEQIKFMDRPQGRWVTAGMPTTPFLRFLINLEEYFYREITLPDLLIVLRTDPEVAVRRKVDEEAYQVRARSMELWKVDWSGSPARVIDANQSLDAVLADVKELIWNRV